jgi:hypothetical protein
MSYCAASDFAMAAINVGYCFNAKLTLSRKFCDEALEHAKLVQNKAFKQCHRNFLLN